MATAEWVRLDRKQAERILGFVDRARLEHHVKDSVVERMAIVRLRKILGAPPPVPHAARRGPKETR
jgi:hypothetical protein